MKKRIPLILTSAIILCMFSACTADTGETQPLQPVASVDLQKYLGRWYEIAKYPNWFQRKCVGNTSADYTLNPDHSITVLNQCKRENGEFEKAEGIAHQIGSADSPKLEVRFAPAWLSIFPFVWGDYWVIDLDEAYSLVAVGEPRREYLWILSRTKEADLKKYNALLQRLQIKGYDTSKLEVTQQSKVRWLPLEMLPCASIAGLLKLDIVKAYTMSNKGNGFALVCLGALMWLVLSSAFDSVAEKLSGTGQSVAYMRSCYLPSAPGLLTDVFDCEKQNGETSVLKITFKVNFSQQLVMANSSGVEKLENCTVFDAENWNCGISTQHSKNSIMKNGEYLENYVGDIRTHSYQVGWFQYQVQDIKRLFE